MLTFLPSRSLKKQFLSPVWQEAVTPLMVDHIKRSLHEVRAFRERKRRSLWFRKLVESCVVYGDRGYRGCEGVIVCDRREVLSLALRLGFCGGRFYKGMVPKGSGL